MNQKLLKFITKPQTPQTITNKKNQEISKSQHNSSKKIASNKEINEKNSSKTKKDSLVSNKIETRPQNNQSLFHSNDLGVPDIKLDKEKDKDIIENLHTQFSSIENNQESNIFTISVDKADKEIRDIEDSPTHPNIDNKDEKIIANSTVLPENNENYLNVKSPLTKLYKSDNSPLRYARKISKETSCINNSITNNNEIMLTNSSGTNSLLSNDLNPRDSKKNNKPQKEIKPIKYNSSLNLPSYRFKSGISGKSNIASSEVILLSPIT